MKRQLEIFILLLAVTIPVRAQLASTVSTQHHDLRFSTGRQFWFAEQSNYWGVNLGEKYLRLYITSPNNTTAYVQESDSGTVNKLAITANEVTSFLMPEAWEMESSGIVENKAIHVWSNDAPLIVYNMSNNSYTSDGEYLVPAVGWDSNYVVAAYGSLFEGGGSYTYDLPSTCAIVSDEDNTTVTITPSCDCRQCTSGTDAGDANSTIVIFPAGATFTETLNHGQSMELMPVKATGPDGFDMTGTIIHSNHLVGLMGGSMCPNIPDDFPYCDHVEDMMPSARTWAETYFVNTNVQQPEATPGEKPAIYLFVASQPGQMIFRSNCSNPTTVECVIPNKYGIDWEEDNSAEQFESNAPFLCVEYLTSSTYPNESNGEGDPAESNVIPQERFLKSLLFETPTNGQPYTNYANLTVNNKDASKTLVDGKAISSIPPICVDSNWSIYVLRDIAEGAHTVTGDDSGVGVYVYGYGFDETYAWACPSYEGTFQQVGAEIALDTSPPIAMASQGCANSSVLFADTGANASAIAAIWIDSSSNMSLVLDPNFTEGIPADSVIGSVAVNNPSAGGSIVLTAYDFSGNSTTVSYAYQVFGLSYSSLDFGTIPLDSTDTLYETISNTSAGPIQIDTVFLSQSASAYRIDSSVMGTLAPDSSLRIKISFSPVQGGQILDTLLIGSFCGASDIPLSGSTIVPADVRTTGANLIASLETTDGRTLTAMLPANWNGAIHAELDDIRGAKIFETTVSSGAPSFDAGPLARGTYFWKLSCTTATQTGKITLGE